MSSTGRTSHSPSNAGQCTRCSSMNCRATFSASSREGTSNEERAIRQAEAIREGYSARSITSSEWSDQPRSRTS
jgi:hypothetical protein